MIFTRHASVLGQRGYGMGGKGGDNVSDRNS